MIYSPDPHLVEEVNKHTNLWRQGDAVELGAITWLAIPRYALTSQSANPDSSCLGGRSRGKCVRVAF